jgi:hypothetical protein
MRKQVLVIPILFCTLASCGSSEKSSDSAKDTSDSSVESNSDTQQSEAPLSSMDNPFRPGDVFNTTGWTDMKVEFLGIASERVARIYDDDYGSNLDYLMVKFSGINKNGEKTNMYATVHSCEPGGSVGKSGTFRQIILGSTFENEESGYQLITTGDDEVLDGFENSGTALYAIERGDTSAFILSPSKQCGYDFDLVVAIGDTSTLPVLP